MSAESREAKRARARRIAAKLVRAYPDARIELDHTNPFELLVATILAAQSTDRLVNSITPELFQRFPNAQRLAAADPAEVEQLVFKTGFFRQKTKSITSMARALVEHHGGEVPRTLDELVRLPGVGRKTANVILGHWFGVPGVVVDTHVLRLARRLGLTGEEDPVRVERDLQSLWRRRDWSDASIRLIYHGRRVCLARRPRCEECVLADFCPSSRV
jgi:endonuclease-3